MTLKVEHNFILNSNFCSLKSDPKPRLGIFNINNNNKSQKKMHKHKPQAPAPPARKRQRTTTLATKESPPFITQIHIGIPSTSAAAAAARVAHLNALLDDAEGVTHHSITLIKDVTNMNSIVKVQIGDFTLRAGDRASECVSALVWCFACLSSEVSEIPEVTYDECDATIHFLSQIKARNNVHHQQAISDTIASIEKMMKDSEPLSKAYAQVYISKTDVLSREECHTVIHEVESHAHISGWGKTRHIAHPTTDLCLDDIPALQWLSIKIETDLLPEFEEMFDLAGGSLSIADIFIAKYEYDENKNGQRGLGEHEDGSPWSFVLPLNPCTDFDGGGTKFVHLAPEIQLYRPTQGKAVLFSGKNRHCGVPITRGVRYILAGFLNESTHAVHVVSVPSVSKVSKKVPSKVTTTTTQ